MKNILSGISVVTVVVSGCTKFQVFQGCALYHIGELTRVQNSLLRPAKPWSFKNFPGLAKTKQRFNVCPNPAHMCRVFSVDATEESGLLGRLVNHSRLKFNCATKVVEVDDMPRLILVAARDVKIDEELLYDYGDRSKESLEAYPWLAS